MSESDGSLSGRSNGTESKGPELRGRESACCENQPEEEHTCPYKSEISDDDESLCTCCEDCAHECAMDI
jgi:hypothetical protein